MAVFNNIGIFSNHSHILFPLRQNWSRKLPNCIQMKHLFNVGKKYLMATHDNSLGAIITLKKTLPVSMIVSWDPDRLLGIIGLEHVFTLHLHGDNQVWCWIWIRLTGLAEFHVTGHLDEVFRLAYVEVVWNETR